MSAKKRDSREDLADYVRRVIKEKNTNTREVVRKSGGRISHGYVSQIMTRTANSITIEKLKALADGLGVPPIELIVIACGEAPDKLPEVQQARVAAWFHKSKKLTPEDRRKLDTIFEMVDQFVDALNEE